MSGPKTLASTEDTGVAINFQSGWGQSQDGPLRQGELLTINYDPQRLTACRASHNGMPAWDLFATARFQPSGEIARGSLLQHVGPQGVLDPPKSIPFSLRIPADATQVEMWFQNTTVFGCSSFDSRFGSNYQFGVDQAGPAQPVMYRNGAQRSVEIVNVFTEKTTKIKQALGNPSAPGSQLETHLELTVWVSNVAYQKNVWIDLHVFDKDDNRVSADTLTLKYGGGAGGNGEFFSLHQMIFLGSGGVPGSVWPRADARKVQYRVYYEVNGSVFTDGILHQTGVLADAEVQQAAAASVAA